MRPARRSFAITGALICLATSLLLGCSGGTEEPVAAAPEPERDNRANVLAYYAERPDFFRFATPEALPSDLDWQDGSELPDIGSQEATKGGTFFEYIADFPRTMRWVGPDSNGSIRNYMIDDIGIFLGHRHPHAFEFYPGLAREWAVSAETKTVYVRLHEDATWSDGEAITADDFFFLFYIAQSPHIRSPWFNNWYSTQYTNITRYDEHTFSISVPEAKPDLDARVLGLTPFPEHFFKEFGEDYVDRYQWQYWPNTGAYRIHEKDIRKGRSITLTRNDEWWARDKKFFRYHFNPDEIVLTVIRDRPKAFESFRRGDIDQMPLNSAEDWYEKLPDVDPDVQAGYLHKSMFYYQHPMPPLGLYINSARPLLEQLDIRLGIHYASNWDLVIERLYRGDYARLDTSNDGYDEFSNPQLQARPFDIELAREHFARAGFDAVGADGILVNAAGQRLSFNVSYSGDPLTDMLSILKEEARKAGIELRLEKLDSTAAWKKVQEKKHDLHYTGFSPFLEMYPRYWESHHSDNAYDRAFLDDGNVNPERTLKTQTNNYESIAIPELDRMIEAYRASGDKGEMIDLAHRMDRMIHDYASFVPGAARDFYRLGHWRWVRYPEQFNYRHTLSADQLWVHWIDQERRTDTRAAMKEGRIFSPQINVYDEYKTR